MKNLLFNKLQIGETAQCPCKAARLQTRQKSKSTLYSVFSWETNLELSRLWCFQLGDKKCVWQVPVNFAMFSSICLNLPCFSVWSIVITSKLKENSYQCIEKHSNKFQHHSNLSSLQCLWLCNTGLMYVSRRQIVLEHNIIWDMFSKKVILINRNWIYYMSAFFRRLIVNILVHQ